MNWKITNLEIQKQSQSFTDVVIKVHWEVSDEYVDSEQVSQKVRYYDVCTLPAPEGDFVPLEELTEAEVLEWIFANGVDKDFAEGKVTEKIDRLNNPPVYNFQFTEDVATVEDTTELEAQLEEAEVLIAEAEEKLQEPE